MPTRIVLLSFRVSSQPPPPRLRHRHRHLRRCHRRLSVWDIGPGDRGEDKRAFGAAFNLLDAPEPVVSSVSQQQVLSGLSGSKAMPAAPRSEGGKLFRKILDWDAQGRDTTYRVNLSVPSTPSSRQWMQAQFPRLQVSVAGSPAGQPSFAGPYEMLAQVEINSLQYFFLVFASAFGDQHKVSFPPPSLHRPCAEAIRQSMCPAALLLPSP